MQQSANGTKYNSTRCNVNVNQGMCTARMAFDNSPKQDLIFCQCSLTESQTAYCRWPGLNS